MSQITICGLGSLLSEASARSTFPTLSGFRLGRISGFRRVFSHPADIFFQRGIADLPSLQMASLSAEPCDGGSFFCAAFEVPAEGGIEAFRQRELEYDLQVVPFAEVDAAGAAVAPAGDPPMGLLCCRSTDAAFKARAPTEYAEYIRACGVDTVWGWAPDSGLRPCAVYLRHCVLAATKGGTLSLNSFLDETFLIDRKTTLRAYLAEHPEVMSTEPPPELAQRYGG
jgi:hypothetical protein